jgi:hypothetical protein
MSLIKAYFDGVEVDAPVSGFSVNLTRDEEIQGLIKTFALSVEWFGSAYSALYTAFISNSLYETIEVEIKRDYNNVLETVFSGIIYVNDIEFDLTKKTATTDIQDSTFYGLINNNKRIKTLLSTNRTKNISAMTGPPTQQIDFFTPSTGNLDYLNRDCFKVFDVFEALIDFMTDGAVSFESNYFDTGGDGENIMIAKGSAIRNDTIPVPTASFYDTFIEMSKLFNLSFRIDSPFSSPVMKIEPTEDLFSLVVSVTLEDVNGLRMSFDKDLFYGILEVGSDTTQDDDAGSFSYPDGAFFGHKKEEYHLLGQSNIDVTLDLVNEWIIDSNVIEDVLVNSNDSYDDDIFIVETDGTQAVEYDNFNPGSTPKYYNFGLNNQSKTERWLGGVPNSIAAFLSSGDQTFEANRSGAQTVSAGTTVLIFNNEVSDPGTNYDNTTGEFAAPADGAYSFEANINTFAVFPSGTTEYYLRHYDSTGVTLYNEVRFANILAPDDFDNDTVLTEYVGSATFYMNATDICVVEAVTSGGSALFSTGTFKSKGNSVDGGIFQFYDPAAFRAIILDFEYPLTKTQFNTIFENQTQRVKITHYGETYYGWVKSIEWDIVTGMAKIQLYTSFNVLN